MTEFPANNSREREIEDIQEESSSIFWSITAGLGAIGLGAAIFRGRVGTLMADSLHYLGHPNRVGLSTRIDQLANIKRSAPHSGHTGIRSIESMTYDLNQGKMSLGPIDLIDDLRNATEILGSNSLTGEAREHFAARTAEYINREQAAQGAFSNFFGRDLKRVTAGDVLANQSNWSSIIGTEGMKILKKARGEKLITKDTILDKNIFLNKKNQLRDVRASRLFYVDPLGKNSSLFGKLTGGINFFGQAGVFKSLAGAKTGIAILNPSPIKGKEAVDRTSARFFIGGDVFVYSKEGKPIQVGSNRKLRLRGDPLEDVTGVRQGWKDISSRRIINFYDESQFMALPDFLKRKLKRAEVATGVGKGFGTRLSFLERWIAAPIARARAIASEKGTVYKHSYKMDQSSSKLTDAMLGAEYPEMIARHGVPIPIEGGGKAVAYKDLTFFQRIGVLFDLASDYSVIKSEAYKAKVSTPSIKLTNLDLVVPVPEGGLRDKSANLPRKFAAKIPHLKRPSVTKAGDVIESYSSRYYDVESSKITNKLTSTRDFANYMFYRVNTLASESLLGIGIAPGKTTLGTMSRLAAIPIVYEGMRQSVEYADFLSEKLTGISPKKLVADLYAGARLGQQSLRSMLGIQQAAKELEENYPGSIESEGFSLMRTAGTSLAAFSLGSKFLNFKAGLGLAGLAYGLVGGPGLGQTREELEAEYQGETKVPVRKGAWWSLGYQGLFGERPKYFDFSWYHKIQTDASYVGQYGSKEEYFKYHQNVFGIPLPTPHNLFGLRYIANPYRFEETNYDSRPYIQTGSNLENFPIFGPALASVFGKTTRYRTPEQLPLLNMDIVDKGVDPQTANLMGIPDVNASSIHMEDPTDPLVRIRKQADIAAEPMGVYKFAMNFFGIDLGPGLDRFATSNLVTSPGRELYQSNIGGALGQSEFIRRFMLTEYSSTYALGQLYNPIPNTMPDWIPGSRSSNKNDQSYFIDFHTGDPISKIERGETRLPGKGYEALNELHSGQEGVYDDVDKLIILADIAPWSDAYRKLEAKMRYMPLSPEWREKVERAKSQRSEVISADNRYPRYFDNVVNDLTQMNQETKDSSMYKSTRKAYDFITHDILSEIPYIGAKLFPFRDPFEQYRRLHVEGSEYADWDNPYEGVVRPAFYDMFYEDPLTAVGKGAALGFLASGPMRYFMPFKGVQAPAGAPSLGMFEFNARTVLGTAAIGGAASSYRIAQGESELGIPEFKQREANFIEYMDKFKYLKYGVLQEEAMSQGKPELVSQFKRQQRKTLVGANNPIMLKASLPTSYDKRFFQYALDEAPVEYREEILAGTPSYLSTALETAFSRDYPSTEAAEQSVANFFSSSDIISTDSVDWHPSIPTSATKFRMIEHGVGGISDNMHRYGFFESHKNEIQNRFPYLLNNAPRFNPPFNQVSYANMISTLQSDIKFKGKYFSPNGGYTEMLQNIDRTNLTTYYTNDYMRIQ